VGRGHGAAAGNAPQHALEQGAELVSHQRSPGAAVPLEQGLGALPDGRVHDGGVLAVVDLVLVPDLADVWDRAEKESQL